MQELQKIVNDKVVAMTEDGSIQKTIECAIEKTITESIQQELVSYGSIAKQIKEGIENGLKIDLHDVPFETYSQQMGVAVKTRLGNLFAEDASSKFIQEIDELLKPAPKEMPIKDFVEQVVEFWRTDDPCNCGDMQESAEVELLKDEKYDWYGLTFWKDRGKYSRSNNSSMGSDLHLMVNSDGKIRINHGQSYNPTCFSDHESYVFKLYSAGTVLTGLEDFDPEDCDLTLVPNMY